MSINLQKITLEKKGDTHAIDLSKRGDTLSKEITVNLNWSKGSKKGFFSDSSTKTSISIWAVSTN